MKRTIIIILLMFFVLAPASSQNKKLLMLFQEISTDSTISTVQQQNPYYERATKIQLPDDLALKYFFKNKNDMIGEEEGYNADENKYHTTKYIKKVCPLFYQKFESSILLYYGIESCFYVSFYDSDSDSFVKTIKVSDFSDDLGNLVTHSIINSKGIFTVHIGKNTVYTLKKMDLKNKDFITVKDSTSADTGKDIEDALREAVSSFKR